MDFVGANLGVHASHAHPKRTRKGTCMATIENIALMSALMLAGVGLTVAVLIGFIYYIESME
jgi:hypothetical protein